MNDFYINIAKEIGVNSNTSLNSPNHPSTDAIKANGPSEGYQSFDFRQVNENIVLKKIKSLSTKKATGIDHIQPKMVKVGAAVIASPICNFFNKCVYLHQFPDRLKVTQVSLIFKKGAPFVKKNYRPVSVLATHSKIFETIMFDQLTDHFQVIFHTYLAAFRKGFGSQTTLLRLAEDWKRAEPKKPSLI